MTIVRLSRTGYEGFRPFAKGVPGALAWEGALVVHVRFFMDYFLWGLARLAHELTHALAETTVGAGAGPHVDDAHHPWYHFCIMVGHPFRLRWTHAPVSRRLVRVFRRNGWVD